MRNRTATDRPVRVGLIGAGKFGTMFLAQARVTVGIHVMAVADLSAPRVHEALKNAGWDGERGFAASFAEGGPISSSTRTRSR